MKKTAIAVLALAAALGAGMWWYISQMPVPGGETQTTQPQSPKSETTATGAEAALQTPAGGVQQQPERRKAPSKLPEYDTSKYFVTDSMSPAEKKNVLAMRDALDNDDFEGVRAFGRTLGQSENPELRAAYVEALSAFGEKAMADLTPFMGDKNGEVAEAAADAWQNALYEVEDEELRLVMAEEAMKLISSPVTLDMLGSELIAIDDDIKMLEALIRVINEGNPSAAAKAKELYKDETDEDWVDIDAAEAWLIRKRAEENGEELPEPEPEVTETPETAKTPETAEAPETAETPETVETPGTAETPDSTESIQEVTDTITDAQEEEVVE